MNPATVKTLKNDVLLDALRLSRIKNVRNWPKRKTHVPLEGIGGTTNLRDKKRTARMPTATEPYES